jgi:pimeloyl-ACP methyl ester carboxylesterase
MTYAARYPEQAAGLVFLDSSSPEQFSRLPDYPGQYALMRRGLALLPTLNRLGVGRVFTAFGGRPLAVVTASENLTTEGWADAQDQLAALSANSTHRVADSTHAGLVEDERGSAASARAIAQVVAAVRTGSPLDRS